MSENIRVSFDKKINGYIISMPEFISLNSIEEWKNKIDLELKSLPLNQKVVMLIDTNKHEFESIQCLKSLREFFTSNAVIQFNIVKVAFVRPKSYGEPHIKSEFEAYFESVEEAYKWLER